VQGAEQIKDRLEMEKAIRKKYKFRWRPGYEIKWKKTVGGDRYGFVL